MKRHPGFISVVLDPTRVWSDYGVIDLEKRSCVCKTSSEREADRIADALHDLELKKLVAPKGLIADVKISEHSEAPF